VWRFARLVVGERAVVEGKLDMRKQRVLKVKKRRTGAHDQQTQFPPHGCRRRWTCRSVFSVPLPRVLPPGAVVSARRLVPPRTLERPPDSSGILDRVPTSS
jgi:hypothetical protein